MAIDLSKYRGRQTASINSGGGAYDAKIPDDDHNPLRNALDFNDPMGAIADAAGQVGEQIRNAIATIIKDKFGIDLSSWDAFLQSLKDGKGIDLPGLVDALTQLGVKVQTIVDAFQGIEWTNPGSVIAGIRTVLRAILPSFLGSIEIGWLTDTQSNSLVAGDFPDAASIYDNPIWIWDSTVTRSADGTGSARTNCNGTLRPLRRAEITKVAAGQTVDLGGSVRWQGLTAAGVTFRLGVRTYLNDTIVDDFVEVRSISSPGAASSSYPGNVSGWVDLPYEWTVPSGINGYQLRFWVTSAATAGTVWFDNGIGMSTGKLALSWMPEAVTKFLSIFHVFGSGGTVEQMQEAWGNLLSVIGIDLPDHMLGSINLTEIWQGIAEHRISPLGFFANLVGGVLPDSQKPAWLQNLTDGISNLFNGSSDTNTGIPNALASLNNIWGTGQSAQASADNANIGVQIIKARLDAVGVVGFDEFDYSSANILPSDKYALSSAGPGNGNYGPNGKGQLVWKPQGFAAREKIYKRTDIPLSTDNGAVTAVWSSKIKDPLFSDGYGYLLGRMYNANNDTHIRARVDNNTAVIQALVAGTVTTIGSGVDVDTDDGDVWEFWYGILSNPYKFWLKQNGSTVLSVEDTGHISQVGADYRMCGVGGRADNYAGVFQIAPPTLNGWTWKDQNLTAVA